MRSKHGDSVETLTIPLSVEERRYVRDAVVKALYQRLFGWLVGAVNRSLAPPANTLAKGPLPFIGVLDIFGFETFEVNTFETLLINHANEVLQHTFNRHVFEAELRLFREEGVEGAAQCDESTFPTNAKCIELIAGLKSASALRQLGQLGAIGIMRILDEVSRTANASDEAFNSKLAQTYDPPKLDQSPRTSRGVKAAESEANPHWIAVPLHKKRWSFCVRHFAADVVYTVSSNNHWVQRNNDAVPSGLAKLLIGADSLKHYVPSGSQSGSPLVAGGGAAKDAVIRGLGRSLPTDSRTDAAEAALSSPRGQSGYWNKPTVSSVFLASMDALTTRLDSTKCSFVRCVKPNQSLSSDAGFDRPYVSIQLRYLGIPQTCHVLRAGLPSRVPFASLDPLFQRLSPEGRRIFSEAAEVATSTRRRLKALLPKPAVFDTKLNEQLNASESPLSIFTACAVRTMGLASDDFAIGCTRLFFRAGKMGAVDNLITASVTVETETQSLAPVEAWAAGLHFAMGAENLEDRLTSALSERRRGDNAMASVVDLWVGTAAAIGR
jgi:myosin heavy subunit